MTPYLPAARLLERVGPFRRAISQHHGLRMVYYHRVSSDPVPYYFDGNTDLLSFTRQLDHLQQNFQVISLGDALQRNDAGDSLDGCLTISFDDGFREVMTHIAPALEDRGLTGTFFLIEDCLNNDFLMWRNKLLAVENHVRGERLRELVKAFGDQNISDQDTLMSASLRWAMPDKDRLADEVWAAADMVPLDQFMATNQPYLNDSDVKKLLAAGHEIGLHSKTHPLCDQLSAEDIAAEIIDPARRLGNQFNVAIPAFSYPFGRRARPEMEHLILDRSDLVALLGISDSLSNDTNAAAWERRGMETDYDTSIVLFYLAPWRQRLLRSISR